MLYWIWCTDGTEADHYVKNHHLVSSKHAMFMGVVAAGRSQLLKRASHRRRAPDPGFDSVCLCLYARICDYLSCCLHPSVGRSRQSRSRMVVRWNTQKRLSIGRKPSCRRSSSSILGRDGLLHDFCFMFPGEGREELSVDKGMI
jgi:hypothetical protein